MLVSGLLAMLAIWLFAAWGVQLFIGDRYMDAVLPLYTLALATPIRYVATSVGSTLVTLDHVRGKVFYLGTATLINLVLNLFLIPIYGVLGSAISTVLSELFLLLIYFQKTKLVFFERRTDYMRLPSIIKNMLKPLRDILYVFFGYLYDFFRYLKFAGWRSKNRESVRDYKAVKIYHRLEKSLSFRWRDTTSGWRAATDLVDHLKKVQRQNNIFTYHEAVGLKVLGDFLTVSPAGNNYEYKAIFNFWQQHRNFFVLT